MPSFAFNWRVLKYRSHNIPLSCEARQYFYGARLVAPDNWSLVFVFARAHARASSTLIKLPVCLSVGKLLVSSTWNRSDGSRYWASQSWFQVEPDIWCTNNLALKTHLNKDEANHFLPVA